MLVLKSQDPPVGEVSSEARQARLLTQITLFYY